VGYPLITVLIGLGLIFHLFFTLDLHIIQWHPKPPSETRLHIDTISKISHRFAACDGASGELSGTFFTRKGCSSIRF